MSGISAASSGNVALSGKHLAGNSSSAPLDNGQTFVGAAADVSKYPSVLTACLTDQSGTMYVEFSTDGENWDSSIPFQIAANTNDVHRITVTRRYFRVRFVNDSGANQTFFRLQCLVGSQQQITSKLDSVVQDDDDTLIVRPIDFNLMVADGLYEKRRTTVKDGFNNDISTGSVPEDIVSQGGVYAGFPTGTPEEGQIVVAGADTGTVWYSYLASDADTEYTFASKSVTGAGTYNLGHNIWRCNYAYFDSGSTINVGAITVRNAVTTTNVFCIIPAGIGQSYCSAYTVPALSNVYIDRMSGNIRGNQSASLDGYFWYRESGKSPILRFPFELQFGSLFFDDVDYLVKIPAGTDIVPRITASSANNVSAKFSYRIVKVRE